jgi:hypothetical protein
MIKDVIIHDIEYDQGRDLFLIGPIDTNMKVHHIGVMNTNLRLKTAQAADVAGVGYEGFRSWLKKGLLKDTGTLPKFYAADAPAEIADAKRWRWSAFGFADLCSFRLAKLFLDAGLSWETVNSVVSENDVWQSHHHTDPMRRYLAIFPTSNQWTLYSAESLADELKTGILKGHLMTLVDLHALQQSVVLRTRAATLRAVAEDMRTTSDISARSGSKALTLDERAQRKAKIEALAGQMVELAGHAEHGAGSYPEFEELLHKLHGFGKFPDNAAVADIATAFTLPLNGP